MKKKTPGQMDWDFFNNLLWPTDTVDDKRLKVLALRVDYRIILIAVTALRSQQLIKSEFLQFRLI
jgi:hypothetical protein